MQIFILIVLLLNVIYGSLIIYDLIKYEVYEFQFLALLNIIIGLLAVVIHIKVNIL